MVNWNEIRKAFPVCDKYIYLNPAGGSPLSANACQESRRFYDEMLEWGDIPYDNWIKQTEQVRTKIAETIGAERKEIAFVPNTSTGMAYIANMLKGMGDVLTMEDEFPSTTVPWLNLDYHVAFVRPDNHHYSPESIEKAITPRTRILLTSYVQYRTGFRQDIEALGNLCAERGLLFVVNATQALPVFPVDVKKDHIDFLVFTGLKWAGSGYGTGILFISKDWLDTLKFSVAGWRSVDHPESMDNASTAIRNEASVLEGGCPSFATVFALGGAIDLFNSIGRGNVTKRILHLSGYLDRKLRALGFTVFSPGEEKHRSGIVMIKTDNAKAIADELFAKKIFVSARGQGLRVSVHIFNNESDLDLFANELNNLKGKL
jgi:cysteine desulfurase / selenocysteine lyase